LSVNTFPDHNIDPQQKNYDWILQFAKAAFNDGNGGMPYGIFYTGQTRYKEIKQYALAKQSINKFKKKQSPARANDKSDQNLDWRSTSLIAGIRERSLSKILQRDYYVNCNAIDQTSKTEQDEIINKLRLKIMMRKMAQEQDSQLANSPQLRQQPGEPEDEEQLDTMAEFGFKNEFAMNAELAVTNVFSYNRFPRERKKSNEESYDIGIGGYRVWIDESGMVRFRAVDPSNLLTSYCSKPDFSDATYIGEAIEVQVADLAPYFTAGQLKDICEKNKGRYGNPLTININKRNWQNEFKVLVFDLQFISYDAFVYKGRVNKFGNEVFGKTDFADIDKERNMMVGEVAEPKYLKNTRKVRYDTKWIVDTDYMYDYGIGKNQNRKLSSWADTQMDYVLEAWNFYEMSFTGMVERLMPLEDEYYETKMKLQNIKRKLIPYLINLDVRALENVNFGQGGEKWEPKQIVDFLFQNHVLVYSGENLLDGNKNQSKGAYIESTGMVQDLLSLRSELQQIKAEAVDTSGLNSITLGNPNAKNLNSTNAAGVQATNDALYLMMVTDSNLTQRLADMIIQKVQCAVSYNKSEHYLQALGMDSVKTIALADEMPLREFGITISDIPSPEERAALLQELSVEQSQGLIEPDDRYLIQTATNLKQAWRILSNKIKKRKEDIQKNELQKIQSVTQQQQQSAMVTAQMQERAMQMQHQFDMEKLNAQSQWDFLITKLKTESSANENELIQQAKLIAAQIQASTKMQNGTTVSNGTNT
jgi:hypothetical protein